MKAVTLASKAGKLREHSDFECSFWYPVVTGFPRGDLVDAAVKSVFGLTIPYYSIVETQHSPFSEFMTERGVKSKDFYLIETYNREGPQNFVVILPDDADDDLIFELMLRY